MPGPSNRSTAGSCWNRSRVTQRITIMTGLTSTASKTFLGNVKVRTKILGGSGVILLALAIVGGLSFLAFSNVAGDFEEFSSTAELGSITEELSGDFTNLRREAGEFLLTEDAAILAEAEELMKEMTANVGQASGLARSEQETKEIAEV